MEYFYCSDDRTRKCLEGHCPRGICGNTDFFITRISEALDRAGCSIDVYEQEEFELEYGF